MPDMVTIDMPIIGPAYDVLYAVLSHLFRQIVDDSYFERWQKVSLENMELKAELREIKASRNIETESYSRATFVPRPTLLPLWHAADSPV
jgi:hypothetical protein